MILAMIFFVILLLVCSSSSFEQFYKRISLFFAGFLALAFIVPVVRGGVIAYTSTPLYSTESVKHIKEKEQQEDARAKEEQEREMLKNKKIIRLYAMYRIPKTDNFVFIRTGRDVVGNYEIKTNMDSIDFENFAKNFELIDYHIDRMETYEYFDENYDLVNNYQALEQKWADMDIQTFRIKKENGKKILEIRGDLEYFILGLTGSEGSNK